VAVQLPFALMCDGFKAGFVSRDVIMLSRTRTMARCIIISNIVVARAPTPIVAVPITNVAPFVLVVTFDQ